MEKKVKLFKIIEIGILIIGISGFILTTVLVKEYKLYFSFQALIYTFLIGLPFLHFLIGIIKEVQIFEFDFPKKALSVVFVLIIYGTLLLMIFYHYETKKTFVNHCIWYGIGTLLGIILAPVLAIVLEKRKKTNNGPKIMKNR